MNDSSFPFYIFYIQVLINLLISLYCCDIRKEQKERNDQERVNKLIARNENEADYEWEGNRNFSRKINGREK